MTRSTVFRFSFIATIGLTVGANATVFAIVASLWIRPRPVRDVEKVVVVTSLSARGSTMLDMVRMQELDGLRALGIFEGVAGQVTESGFMGDFAPRLVVRRVGRRVGTVAVTPNYFEVLGVSVRGIGFSASAVDVGGVPPLIISDRLWASSFGRDEAIVGSTLESSHGSVRIVGVASPGFHGARLGEQYDVWLPISYLSQLNGFSSLPEARLLTYRLLPLLGLARLQPEIPFVDAHAQVERIGRLTLVPLSRAYGSGRQATTLIDESRLLRILLTAAALILAAGGATLTVLLLMEYERRRGEFALRVALGSSRVRLVRLLGSELLAMGTVGTMLSFAIAYLACSAAGAFSLPSGIALSRVDVHPDGSVLAVTLLVGLLIIALAAAVPLVLFTGRSATYGLLMRHSGSTIASARVRSIVLAAHSGFTTVSLVLAWLFVTTIRHGFGEGPGFDIDRTLFLRVQPGTAEFYSAAEGPEQAGLAARRQTAYRRLLGELERLPGIRLAVRAAAPIEATRVEPFPTLHVTTDLGGRDVRMRVLQVQDEYFDVLGVHRLASLPEPPIGSQFTPATITRGLASDLWPQTSPLGRRLVVGRTTYMITAVVADLALGSLRMPADGGLFIPPGREPQDASESVLLEIALRTDHPSSLYKHRVREVTERALPMASRVDVDAGTDLVRIDFGRQLLGAAAFGGFGLVALILAVTGVFGLVSYEAARRRRDTAVRLALGASSRAVRRATISPVVIPACVGAVIGLPIAAALSSSMKATILPEFSSATAAYSGALGLVTITVFVASLCATGGIRDNALGTLMREEV